MSRTFLERFLGMLRDHTNGAAEPEGAKADDDPSILDLRHLPMRRMRVRGTAYVVSSRRRLSAGAHEYILRREPTNKHDSYAIAIYDGTNKVGYLTTSTASRMAPLLDLLGHEGYRVGGLPSDGVSVKLWVDVPLMDGLKRLVKSHAPRSSDLEP
ncbi:HIRAN domain-containing protein [Microcella sp.]|uniref:HIRAN domain-containing protein n=1 Tax=Microcella sp. TaxID=1913979 RepID=UPI00391961A6